MVKTNHFSFLAVLVTSNSFEECLGFSLKSKPTSFSSRDFQQRSTPKAPTELNANLITFDLDDTIFPVGPVVADANKALFDELKLLGCETTQEEYLKTTKRIRIELAKEDKVITYTELRKRSIRKELQKYLPDDKINDSLVVGLYDTWEEHRHIAAETHLYPDTISMLKELKNNLPDAVIAAITNGKGNPLMMDSIREYFDFCVSGEDDDVFPLRKPSEGIYKVALKRFEELSLERNGESIDMEEQCWVHVGDDLANDVGASAKCGAKAVWVDLGDEYNQTASKRSPSEPQPAWSSATKEEMEKRKRMNENAQKYVTKRVTTLDMLPSAIYAIADSFTTLQ